VLPIFLVSSVTGKNLDLLYSFFNLLTASSELRNNEELSTEFSISNKYEVNGNIILAGTVIKGTVKKGQLLHIGPDLKGAFRAVEVKSI
jgi:GTPase